MNKRKSMTGIGKGVDAFFEKPEEISESIKQYNDKEIKQQNDKAVERVKDKEPKQQKDIAVKQQEEPDLARATFYIKPEEDLSLEELRIKLRKMKVRTNKSELIRMAIGLLLKQETKALADKLTASASSPIEKE